MLIKRFAAMAVFAFFGASLEASEITYDDIRSLKNSSERLSESKGSDLLRGIDSESIGNSADRFRKDARAALESVVQQRPMKETAALEKYGDVETIYFVSMSLGEESLKRIFEEAGTDRVKNLVVIQGIREGGKLPAGLQPYFRIVKEVRNPPAFVLDPSLFDTYKVNKVPAIVKVDPSKPVMEQTGLAKVYGLESSRYIDEQLARGESGNLGIKGNVAEIEEPNLIEVMKEKLAAVNWEVKKEKAMNRFWDNQDFIDIPRATEDRERKIDPTILVTANIATPDGDIIARKGDRINPLEKLPFNRVVYIFNPTSEAEIEFVKSSLGGHDIRDGKPVLIASELYRESGWDKYEKLTDELNHPVYKLMPDIKNRWSIERTPSVIRAEEKHFIVTEHALDERGGQ